jgi:phosphatidylglycerophosphatase A
MKRSAAYALATWFGCGYWPKGPGTAGSIAAAILVWAGIPAGLGAMLLLLPGVWASGEVERHRGKDPQIVVVDEVVGQWITLIPASGDWKAILLGLVLFRLFDITKPWPVRKFEALPGGWGIMMDDVAAGVLGGVVMLSARWFNLIS